MRICIVAFITALFVLAACQDNSFRIINHERPDLQVDFPYFKEGQRQELGCDTIRSDDLLGGFTPAYPIARCEHTVLQESGILLPPDECLVSTVRIYGANCARLVIFKNERNLIIKNIDALRGLFAPVNSPEEALSFAIAATVNEALYGQQRKENYVYEVKKLEDTYVESLQDEYLVHLFYTPTFGCGPLMTHAVTVRVTRDGHVEEAGRYPVYRDPSLDEVCSD
jgi:hypothetical protein